jgi:hypothetical protein
MHLGPAACIGEEAVTTNIRIETNADEVAAKISEMPGKVSRGVQAGLNDIADEILAESQWLVPVRDGTLKKSGNVQYGNMFAVVGYNTPYARFMESGTKPHIIAPKRKGFLAWPTEALVFGYKTGPGGAKIKPTGWAFTTKPVHHPGTKPYRYLEGAVDRVLPRIESIMGARIQQALEQGA